jgi:hypothetical protein
VKILLGIVIGGVVLYWIIKFILLLLRPFFVRKYGREIDSLYRKIHNECVGDLNSALSHLEDWKNMDRAVRDHYKDEESINDRINTARTEIKHEEQLYDKFMRLQVRFIDDYEKLGEGIASYKSYLDLKLNAYYDAESPFASGPDLTSEAWLSHIDAIFESNKKRKIVLEEFERKIDVLLNE